MYPNNLFLVYIYSRVIKFVQWLGINEHAYFALLVFQCMIYWIVGVVLFYIILVLKKDYRIAIFTYILYIILVGLSPWVSIPYSDSVALFFPAVILALYVKKPSQKFINYLRWYMIAFFSYVGYRIKPQAIIITLAIVCVHILLVFIKNEYDVNVSKRATAFICGLLCSYYLVNCMCNTLQIKLDIMVS